MDVSGWSGELRVGYQVAARLGAWALAITRAPALRATLRAEVLAADAYWVRSPAFGVALAIGSSEWRWADAVVTIDLTAATATAVLLGRPAMTAWAPVRASAA